MLSQRRRLIRALVATAVTPHGIAVGRTIASGQHRVGHSLPVFSPLSFGAKGDGVVDDTSACNAAAAEAHKAGGELVFPEGKVFAISSSIVVRSDVRGVTGQGGIIRCINTDRTAGILLAGGFRPGESNVEGCIVRGLRIDCGWIESADTIGIFGQNIANCQILENHIFNLRRGYGILLRSFFEGRMPTRGNLLKGNRIDADTAGAHTCWGIGMDAMLKFTKPFKTTVGQWKGSFTVPETTVPIVRNVVRDNEVVGGYYGLAMYSASENEILSNRFSKNTRSISLQTLCVSNTVERNECMDCSSSAIHLAYGSSGNKVIENTVRSTRSSGEGLLQAYVGAMSNLFQGNVTHAIGPSSPKYHMYAGAHADGNRFVGNRLNGRCARAYVGVESAFSSKLDVPSHRAYRGGPEYDHFAERGMSGIVIDDNSIHAESDVAVISLVQVSDERGSYPLTDVTIRRNTVATAAASPLLIISQTTRGGVSGVVMEGNRFPTTSRPSDFVLPEGDRHFVSLKDNVGMVVPPR